MCICIYIYIQINYNQLMMQVYDFTTLHLKIMKVSLRHNARQVVSRGPFGRLDHFAPMVHFILFHQNLSNIIQLQ